MPEHIVEAWEAYFSYRTDEPKRVLIDHYQFLVKNIMRPFWAKKPFLLDMEDLRQSGTLGLIQAIERYQKGSDASFETFAQLRVKGAMLDEINSLDWTPRNMRKQIREVLEAESKIIAHGEILSNESIALMTKLTVEEVAKARASSHRTYILPVDQDSIREMEATHGSQAESQGSSAPLDGVHRGSEGLDFRLSLMKELAPDERQVVYLRFFCGESMEQIAHILRIPKTRVSALHKRALEKLKLVYDQSGQKDSL